MTYKSQSHTGPNDGNSFIYATRYMAA